MSSTHTQQNERQTSDRPRFSMRRLMFMLVAASLLVAAGNASALPALPVQADHRSDIATPIGGISAAKQGQDINACAHAYPSASSLPVPVGLPVAVPQAHGAACARANLDSMTVDARAGARLAGVADPTGLVPTQFGLRANADLENKDIDFEAQSGSPTAQGLVDKITDTVRSAWSTIRGLL